MAEQAEVTMVTLTVNGTTVTEPVEPRTLSRTSCATSSG